MYCLPCLVLLVLLVAAAKINLKSNRKWQGTKQSRQADKAVRYACSVLCLLLALAISSGFLLTNIP
jgi:hypothetical protein